MSSVQLAVPSSVAEVTVPRRCCRAGVVVVGAGAVVPVPVPVGGPVVAAAPRIARAARPGDRAGESERGEQLRARHLHFRDGLQVVGVVLTHGLVRDRHLRLELIEQRIVEIGPPIALRRRIRGRRLRPAFGRLFLELPSATGALGR